MTVFADGRAIIKGTKDPAVARSLYARYIGSYGELTIIRGKGSSPQNGVRRTAACGAIHVFAAIHQREQRAQNAGLDFIRHRIAAGGHVNERFAARRRFSA